MELEVEWLEVYTFLGSWHKKSTGSVGVHQRSLCTDGFIQPFHSA